MKFVSILRRSCVQLFVVCPVKTSCMCNLGPALRATTGALFSNLRRLLTFTPVPNPPQGSLPARETDSQTPSLSLNAHPCDPMTEPKKTDIPSALPPRYSLPSSRSHSSSPSSSSSSSISSSSSSSGGSRDHPLVAILVDLMYPATGSIKLGS